MKTTVILATILVLGATGVAGATLEDDISAIMKRIEARTPQVLQYKDRGVIGETWDARLDIVKGGDDTARTLVAAENKDRAELIPLLARKNDTTVDEARRTFAAFRFKKAADTHYFKGRNGQWKTKAEWSKAKPGPFDE